MGSWEITKLRLEAQIANLEAVIDQKDDDNVYLIDQLNKANARVAELEFELDGLRRDTWRPHR